MGFFDKMKSAVGLGGNKITIEVEENEKSFSQGSSIIGKLILKGGADLTVNSVKVQLKRKWIEPGDLTEIEYADGRVEYEEDSETSHTDVLDEVALNDSFQIHNSYEESFDFDFPIPFESDISIENEMEYYLFAQADISGAPDPKDRYPFEIVPSYEIQAFEKVLEESFGFDFQGEFSENGRILVDFLAPAQIADKTSRVGFSFLNTDEGLDIVLYYDLEGLTFGDYVRASVGKDVPKFNMMIPYEQIINGDDIDLSKVEAILKQVFDDLKWN